MRPGPIGAAVAVFRLFRPERVTPTVSSRSCEFEDLERAVHDAAGLAAGFGDVTSAGEVVGADGEVAQAGHDARS